MTPARALRSTLPLMAAALLSAVPVAHADPELGGSGEATDAPPVSVEDARPNGWPIPVAIDCAAYDRQHGPGSCAAMCEESDNLGFALPNRAGWHLVDITCDLVDGTAYLTRIYRYFDGGEPEFEQLRVIKGGGGGVDIDERGGVLGLRGDAEIFVVVESPEGGRSEGYVSAEGGSIEVSVGDIVWVAFADPLAEGEIELVLP
jgi:hypothetical protein